MDGLSAPVSIAGVILQCMLKKNQGSAYETERALNTGKPLHIVLIGATAVNEEV